VPKTEANELSNGATGPICVGINEVLECLSRIGALKEMLPNRRIDGFTAMFLT
jgi:hypothetical protein